MGGVSIHGWSIHKQIEAPIPSYALPEATPRRQGCVEKPLAAGSIFTEEPGKAKRIITGSAVRTTKCHYVDLLYFVQCALPKNLAIKHRAYSSMPNAMQRLKSSLV